MSTGSKLGGNSLKSDLIKAGPERFVENTGNRRIGVANTGNLSLMVGKNIVGKDNRFRKDNFSFGEGNFSIGFEEVYGFILNQARERNFSQKCVTDEGGSSEFVNTGLGGSGLLLTD